MADNGLAAGGQGGVVDPQRPGFMERETMSAGWVGPPGGQQDFGAENRESDAERPDLVSGLSLHGMVGDKTMALLFQGPVLPGRSTTPGSPLFGGGSTGIGRRAVS